MQAVAACRLARVFSFWVQAAGALPAEGSEGMLPLCTGGTARQAQMQLQKWRTTTLPLGEKPRRQGTQKAAGHTGALCCNCS